MSGEMTHDLIALRNLLAASTVFQDWCDAVDATDALAHISLFSADTKTAEMPHAVVNLAGWQSECVTLNQKFDVMPGLAVEFVVEVDRADTNQAVFLELVEGVDEIMDDVKSNTEYRIQEYGPADDTTPGRTTKSKSQDYATFRVSINANRR